ncbi:protein CHROMATIN REMODELING 8 [Punica granatum]|uniref:Protein CHROMATIN REMODELING 8 n=1 Tax=Punica granatum TaxID=22663 RepID=A0A6P8BPF6_PUNGR|nr:protein CHROMATIN REMODELING 8 [Punica granatum]
MEDGILLRTLGVTSANPEEIERHVIAEAEGQNDAGSRGSSEDGEPLDEDTLVKSKVVDPSSSAQTKLYNKLRAIEYEIDAVVSSVEQVKNAADNESRDRDDNDSPGAADKEDQTTVFQSSRNGFNLHHALAADRLRSLKQTKSQLEKELSELQEGQPSKAKEHDRLLRSFVKDEPSLKRKPKAVQKTDKKKEKRQKISSFNDDDDFDAVLDAASVGFVETERDELVRKGLFTPFHKLKGYERRIQEPGSSHRSDVSEHQDSSNDLASTSVDRIAQSMSEAAQARSATKLVDSEALPKLDPPTFPFQRLKTRVRPPRSPGREAGDSGKRKKRPLPDKKWRKAVSREDNRLGDGDSANDNSVTLSYEEEKQDDVDSEVIDSDQPPSVILEGGLKIPESMFSKLFDYQKVGVQWLWELHCQRAGGIIGDEMGLGKTVQVLSFLGALHFSNMYKPSIVVCPVTLLRQWKREAQKWYPRFHVEILHDSAHDMANQKRRGKYSESDYDSDDSIDSDEEEKLQSKNKKNWDSLIKHVLGSESGLLITTYEQLRLLGDKLLDIEWGYTVLDEGHRIRNPNAEITLVCKQLQTVHRIIMTGAPIQNRLSELWSLFDFVFPGKLGVLPVFEAEFAVPITVGGYANASPLQVSTAYRCAVVLRDLIMPYLLRRMKADVSVQLPKKTEHVLFCSLTAEQRSVYRAFLASSDVEQILDGNRRSLYGIDVMRKICNHPDLLEREHSQSNPDYGNPERSGKMKVVAEVLKVWKEQGHRVLLFAQTQQMLDIVENFLISCEYNYRRMDGLTPVKQRMALIDEFNDSNDVFIFILTTKVGGLGTNLTGADRVIIFDPDWNPSTDMQARERAWRIGQKRDVTVYRLITRGTIEEKVYHRQIYKHFLTNKILKNPQQRRFFKARDMKDLFILNDEGDSGTTETSNIFRQLSEDLDVIGAQNDKDSSRKTSRSGASKKAQSSKNYADVGSSRMKGKEKAEKTSNEVDGETDILKSLLDAHGIHSAVNHDVIMNAHDGEKLRLEEQASQVAQRAAEALRQSRMLRSHESISIPTWTGKSGAAGAPISSSKKFGSTVYSQLIRHDPPINGVTAGVSSGKALSSSELLARIRGNQERAVGAALESQNGRVPNTGGPSRSFSCSSSVQPEVLIRQICTYIQQRGGSASSASIVEHFKDRVPSKDLPLFKSLLKEIASLQKNPNGSVWVLKAEYQQQ